MRPSSSVHIQCPLISSRSTPSRSHQPPLLGPTWFPQLRITRDLGTKWTHLYHITVYSCKIEVSPHWNVELFSFSIETLKPKCTLILACTQQLIVRGESLSTIMLSVRRADLHDHFHFGHNYFHICEYQMVPLKLKVKDIQRTLILSQAIVSEV